MQKGRFHAALPLRRELRSFIGIETRPTPTRAL